MLRLYWIANEHVEKHAFVSKSESIQICPHEKVTSLVNTHSHVNRTFCFVLIQYIYWVNNKMSPWVFSHFPRDKLCHSQGPFFPQKEPDISEISTPKGRCSPSWFREVFRFHDGVWVWGEKTSGGLSLVELFCWCHLGFVTWSPIIFGKGGYIH